MLRTCTCYQPLAPASPWASDPEDIQVDATLPGHSAPNAGFEVPVEMLTACHGRIEHRCETLRRMAAHLPVHGADAQARDAGRAVMRYFDTAARDHHADEEHDLFPALLESMAGYDATCIRDLTTSLCAEHQHLEQLVARSARRARSGGRG
jgi:hypothetical protein